MASYSTRVRSDIARWVEAGLIDASTGQVLARDVEANQRASLSFGSILAMMAALLFGAAIPIFVAANWEAIPRLVRVIVLFAVILAGYVGGAVAKTRDHAAIGEALWIIAAAAFGGSMALIGQMYHLSGDEASALLVWGAGTTLAAVALRSNPLTIAAVGIADAWMVLKGFDYFGRHDLPHLFLLMAAVLFAVSFWTRSQPARHLILLSLIFYLVLLAVDDASLTVAIPLVVGSAALFAIAVAAPGPVDRIVQLGGRLPLHALIGFLTANIVGRSIVSFGLHSRVGGGHHRHRGRSRAGGPGKPGSALARLCRLRVRARHDLCGDVAVDAGHGGLLPGRGRHARYPGPDHHPRREAHEGD